MNVLRIARRVALAAITVLVTASTLVAFGESYRALYLWAVHHGVPFGWALIWPAMVDTFVAVGELSLVVGMTDRWKTQDRIAAWVVTLVGLAVSVAGNIGHIAGHDLASRLTAAVPPVAAAASLMIALGTLKRIVGGHHESTVMAQAENVPGTVVAEVADSVPQPVVERVPDTVPELLGQRVSEISAVPATAEGPESAPESTAEDVPAERPEPAAGDTPKPVARGRAPSQPQKTAPKRSGRSQPVTPERAAKVFEADLQKGEIPSLRALKSTLHVGTPKARQLREELLSRVATQQQAA